MARRLLGRSLLGDHLLDDRRTLHEHAHGLVAHQLDLLLAKAELDQTAALRVRTASLAGRRLARTDMRFFTECTTCTHF